MIGCTPLLLALAASGFDADTGKVSTEGAAFAISFDNLGAIQGLGVSGYDVFNGTAYDELQVGALIEPDAEEAIEGGGALAMGGDLTFVHVALENRTDLAELVGRRVEVILWQKARGTHVTPSLTWYGGDPLGPTYLGALTLQPSGEVTSDGWERWTSGAVDWAWAEAIGPATLDLYDEAYAAAYGGASPDPSARALVDALHVVDLGPALVTASTCALPTEDVDCGDAGLCHLGRCVDAAIRAGQALIDDDLRSDYLDRRLFEIRTFEGGRSPRGKLELVSAALGPLKAGPANARTFWPTLGDAYTLLVDGHASAPLLSYPLFQNGGVCVHEGSADLVPTAAPADSVVPLVFQPGASLVGAQLQPGDALVRIDGLPTAQWVDLARRLIAHGGDPEGRSVVTAPAIFTAAIDTGAVVTFARCAGGADGSTPCAAEDVTEIVLDLGALVGDAILAGETVLSYEEIAACDYRFKRPVPSTAVRSNTDYAFAGSTNEGAVRFLVINGVPGYYGDGGEEWFTQVQDALEDAPGLLVLDERTGGGGGVDAVDWIAAALLAPNDLLAMDFLASFEADDFDVEALGAARQAAVDCSVSGQSGLGCGNSFRWFVGDVAAQGDLQGVSSSTKLAVLIGSDVSGNDYLTRMLNQRTTAATRVFGAGSTWGAYGVIWSMASHLGELSGGSLQVQDTIFVANDSDTNVAFATSTGERPDEIVRQKQSDALAGRDTVIEAARAWLEL
jgi:hypothetical protein